MTVSMSPVELCDPLFSKIFCFNLKLYYSVRDTTGNFRYLPFYCLQLATRICLFSKFVLMLLAFFFLLFVDFSDSEFGYGQWRRNIFRRQFSWMQTNAVRAQIPKLKANKNLGQFTIDSLSISIGRVSQSNSNNYRETATKFH